MEGTRPFTMDEVYALIEETRARRKEGDTQAVNAEWEAGRPLTMDDYWAWFQGMQARSKEEGRDDLWPEELQVLQGIWKHVEANGNGPKFGMITWRDFETFNQKVKTRKKRGGPRIALTNEETAQFDVILAGLVASGEAPKVLKPGFVGTFIPGTKERRKYTNADFNDHYARQKARRKATGAGWWSQTDEERTEWEAIQADLRNDPEANRGPGIIAGFLGTLMFMFIVLLLMAAVGSLF